MSVSINPSKNGSSDRSVLLRIIVSAAIAIAVRWVAPFLGASPFISLILGAIAGGASVAILSVLQASKVKIPAR